MFCNETVSKINAKKNEKKETTSACKEPKNNGRLKIFINFPINII